MGHVGTHLRKCRKQTPAIADAGDPKLDQVFIGEISENSIVYTFPEKIFKEVLAPFRFENGLKL